MPGLAQRNEQFTNGLSTPPCSLSANGFWSKNSDDVSYNQLQKFWSELSPQARQKLLKIDKQSLFEQARKNMYCSRCNGLLLEGFLQIVMYGKSLQQEGVDVRFPCNRPGGLKKQNNDESTIINGCRDEIQDPSVHPWGGLTTARDGSLTLMNCYLYSKSLKGLQIVFDGARARERERELLYPDACGGGGRGWISQGIVSYGRGHGTRETCALHTARLSCDTLVDFWSALGEETRLSLLRMKEEDFIERLMYRFDSKRFCRDCRRNVIREFKELKELKRMRREPRCTSWFCVADSAFQYEVSDDSVQADWRQIFADASGTYHHFEWAVGTTEGKSDILEFENVGLNGCVRASGLDLGCLSACFITLRAWRLDGRCTELSVKAHSLKGQQCVHCRLIVGDGYVTITKGESIRRFFEHAEEAEEEEDDDSIDKDGNELDGECSRPQKHAKSPELAREFLLDAATVIFKEQVEKAFREGTARQNAHSIFVCLALKLLEERVHVACKEIITLEKQMKLLEEEEKEKREEEERKERRRTKEREKKIRRKERLKGKDKEKRCSEANDVLGSSEISKEELSAVADMEQSNPISCGNSVIETDETDQLRDDSPNIQDDDFSSECNTSKPHDLSYDDCDEEVSNTKDEMGQSTVEQSMLSHRRLRSKKEFQLDMPMKWSDRRRYAVVSENGVMVGRSEPRHYGDNFVSSSRVINGLNRQSRINVPTKSNVRNVGPKYNEKFYNSKNQMSDRCENHSCSCSMNNEYKMRVGQHSPMTRVSREMKPPSQSESAGDTSKQFYRGSKNNQVDYMHESNGRPRCKIILGNHPSRDLFQSKKVWEPTESQKKYPRSSSDSDVILRFTKVQGAHSDLIKSSIGEAVGLGEKDDEECNSKRLSGVDERCQNDFHVEAEGSCNSTEIASGEPGTCPTGGSSLNSSSDLTQSSTSSSDNCSSCPSEGDNNTASSNHENPESLTTSDSEDVSQQSEAIDNSACMENVLLDCHEVAIENNNQNASGEDLATSSSSLTGPSLDDTRNDATGNLLVEIAQNFDNGLSTANVCSQPQSMLPPVSNQNIHFPVFQAPSTMGYFHQNPVSWSAAPPNGLMPFVPPNHYLYAGPLGYGLNEDPRFCLQYGALQQPTPLFNPAVPVYQPVARANLLNAEERTQVSKPASLQEHLNGSLAERAFPAGAISKKPALNGEVRYDNSAKSPANNNDFSLFHFGGPVALSTSCKSTVASSNGDTGGNFSLKSSADHVEKVHSCNKKETTSVEEYNLFAASNNLSFQFSKMIK
ncbi:hypothetical protein RJT34_20230 [Clitoria ternatea]|uniref:Uncharacterized protein n=1 Tax=Clitoria ternatea TaxID=43366 RepID=A0AAN9ISJ9_CLITE